MKTFFTMLTKTVLLALIFSFNVLNAQMSNPNSFASNQFESANKVICTLVSFTATHVEGKVYLKWVVNGLKEDCVYFIQRSRNDVDFETIGTRNGVGVEPNIDILTCFTDSNPLNTKTYYRIATINNIGELKYTPSQIIDVKNSIGVNNSMIVENN